MVNASIEAWVHPEVILVATDLTDLTRLMPVAIRQAADSGARLLLLHAVSTASALPTDAAGLPYYDMTGALETANEILQPWAGEAQCRGISCRILVREGYATHEIGVAIRQFHADRIILGTRSHSKLGKLLVGSVAEQVLRSVYIPVITVGPEAHLQEVSRGESAVLLATNLRETFRPGAVLACRIAAAQHSRLILLHVLPPINQVERGLPPSELDSMALRDLRQLVEKEAEPCGVEIEAVIAHGNPAIEILAESAARRVGLILLGATERAAFGELMRSRTIYRVLAHATCPVLTYREPQSAPGTMESETVVAHH